MQAALEAGTQPSLDTSSTSARCPAHTPSPREPSRDSAEGFADWPMAPPTHPQVLKTWSWESLMAGHAPLGMRPYVDWRFKYGKRPDDPLSLKGWIEPYIETQCSHTCCTISGCVLVPWMRCCQLGVTYQRNSLLACEYHKFPNNRFVRNLIPKGGHPDLLNPQEDRWKCMWSWDEMCHGYLAETMQHPPCYDPKTNQGIRDLCPAKTFCSDSKTGHLQYLSDHKGQAPPRQGRNHPLGSAVDGWTMQGKGVYKECAGAAVLMWILDWLGPIHIGMYLHEGYAAAHKTILAARESKEGREVLKRASLEQGTDMPVVYWDAYIQGSELAKSSGLPAIQAIPACGGCSKGHHCETLVGYRYFRESPAHSYFILLDQHGQDHDDQGFAYLSMNLDQKTCAGMFDDLSQPSMFFSERGIALRPPDLPPTPSHKGSKPPRPPKPGQKPSPPSPKHTHTLLMVIIVVAGVVCLGLLGLLLHSRKS